MRLQHLLFWNIILTACGTTPSDEQPSGCQSDEDCKQNRICLEEICQEQWFDATISDTRVVDAIVGHPINGYILTVAKVEGVNQILKYGLVSNTFSYMKDRNDNLLVIQDLNGAELSPSGNMLAYITKKNDEAYELSTYNLNTGENNVVAQNREDTWFHFGNDDELFYTRFGKRTDGTDETAIYKINVPTVMDPIKVLSFPLRAWSLDFTVEPTEKKIAFTCVPKENLDNARQGLNDPSIYTPLVLCLTDYNTIHPEQFRHFEYGLKGSLKMIDVDLAWDRYPQGSYQYDSMLKVFMLCREEDSVGLCASIHVNNIGVIPYFFEDTAFTIIPNEDHSQILLGDVIYDRGKSTPENPSLYRIPWNKTLEGKEVKVPGTIFGFRTEEK